jgi:CRISPR system Cascade subunit CasC
MKGQFKMFIELHIIQNFPPSNLNRDDVGQPKSTDFGGMPRARISSQCLKRSIRFAGKDPKDADAKSVFERYTPVPLADRTKMIVSALVALLYKGDDEKQKAQAKMLAIAFAEEYAGGMDSKRAEKTNVLLYLSDQEQSSVAEKLRKNWDALIAALSPEKPLEQVARQFAEKIGQRASEPAKNKVIHAKNLNKEIQARLEKGGRESKGARAIAGDFKKAFKSDTKAFTAEELDWASAEIVKCWDVIQAQKKAESPLKPIVDELIKETKGRTSAPDIALFGRMLADKPETNIDAACQVAHAISTHAVSRNDLDYFTAVDDLQPKDETGAGFLDVAYFNSACFYRYARIDFALLAKNLGDTELARRTVEAFLRASEAAIPSGKKNSHAQEVRPDFMLVVLRSDDSAGWSLVNAFETPVRANQEQGLLVTSAHTLCDEFDDHCERYGAKTIVEKSVLVSGRLERAGAVTGRLANAIAKAESDDKSALDVMVETICKQLPQGA